MNSERHRTQASRTHRLADRRLAHRAGQLGGPSRAERTGAPSGSRARRTAAARAIALQPMAASGSEHTRRTSGSISRRRIEVAAHAGSKALDRIPPPGCARRRPPPAAFALCAAGHRSGGLPPRNRRSSPTRACGRCSSGSLVFDPGTSRMSAELAAAHALGMPAKRLSKPRSCSAKRRRRTRADRTPARSPRGSTAVIGPLRVDMSRDPSASSSPRAILRGTAQTVSARFVNEHAPV